MSLKKAVRDKLEDLDTGAPWLTTIGNVVTDD